MKHLFQGVYKIARMSLRLAEAKKVLLGLPRAIVINLYKYYTSLCLLTAKYAVVVWWKWRKFGLDNIFATHLFYTNQRQYITGNDRPFVDTKPTHTLTRNHIAIFFIDTSNNAWHNNAWHNNAWHNNSHSVMGCHVWQ